MHKAVLVTGAAQGVGQAIAKRMASEGARRLALVDINQERLDCVAAELRDNGCEVLAIGADLTDVNACRNAVAAAERVYGSLDVVVNAAGLTLRGGVFDTDERTFDRLFAVNVRAPMFIMQAALPAMIEAGRGGVVVNISSMNAHGGPAHLLPYSASKAALNTMTRNVANTVRWHRIRVHAINLGWTVTPAEDEAQMKVHGRPSDWAKIEGDNQPFGRLLSCDDAAALCGYLASDGAGMMTGCVIDQEQWVVGAVASQRDQ
ncbi:oxidoreductase [Burkholderia aenigmatica]|uniref:Short-chain dehydrogenase n=1 Tax=Burkholderia aenigmatica TaxID=2015348 RepID=A0A228IN84_9BURK|nr:oxidoreductase [Burkholderia aenigmatica]OXI43826.1 short-chain dehydrogenase [Burkholderia aenigmatica]